MRSEERKDGSRTLMLVLVKMLQPPSVEAGRAPDDTMHLVPLLQQ
jgi:hypothetical protein